MANTEHLIRKFKNLNNNITKYLIENIQYSVRIYKTPLTIYDIY